MTGLVIGVALLVVGLAALAVVGLVVRTELLMRRATNPQPAPRTTRAQRRVQATRRYEAGDPEATQVLYYLDTPGGQQQPPTTGRK